MKFTVGSQNPVKLEAVRDVVLSCDMFKNAEFKALPVDSGFPEQPVGLEETIGGARNRAVNAFRNCDLSVGLESGLIPVPLTDSGYMNLTACAIYDGSAYYTGLGPAFELPRDIARLVIIDRLDLNEAVLTAGLSRDPHIGRTQGLIGLLSGGRVSRAEYSKPAVSMALTRLYQARR